MNFVWTYLVAFAAFMVFDLLWLGLVAQKIYQKYLGYLMAKSVNWTAALTFYALFVFGIVYFVLNPSLAEPNLTQLLTRAALFGLLTYATYDLTNLATVRDWPITITIIDLVWGTTLSVSVSLVTYLVALQFWVN